MVSATHNAWLSQYHSIYHTAFSMDAELLFWILSFLKTGVMFCSTQSEPYIQQCSHYSFFFLGKSLLAKAPKYNSFHNASNNFPDKRDYSKAICGFLWNSCFYFSWQQMIATHLLWTLSWIENQHPTFLVVYSLVPQLSFRALLLLALIVLM